MWADGPDHYVIKGKLTYHQKVDEIIRTDHVAFEHGSESGSWYGQTFVIPDGGHTAQGILVRGSRDEAEGVMIKIGVTDGDLNAFSYGDTVTLTPLPLTY
ncbi:MULTISPECIES: hypothetical protein [unclassified Streptomyces]|uniref:hypothetical protein n=1 Tax=unclassified Streptomyces TaxID=2593676 RepID=UPI0011E67EBC|nr:hypothetical protein [Streptomyces sp. sk2.1]TXS63137.1 hypothetical protein EAO76_40705 [Streptomyces sp. sk2.1]